MSDAASRAAVPATTTLAEATAGLLRALASCFEVTTPVEQARIAHRLLLFAIVCAGVVVRFWGLGGVGLHGDEETMAMAVMHIVKDGRPILPSGMFYPRGLTELYMMALSVLAFGESEWAFRLPSALFGVLLIPMTYLAGRRFLRPQWNLALAATVAVLPEIVDYSQTARMYIFLLVAIAACMACLFEWERSGRLRWLIGAVATLTVGLQLHQLAVTIVLLFLMPGILQGDGRKLLQGMAAAAFAMVAFVAFDAWANSQYPVPPPEYAADLPPLGWRAPRTTTYPLPFQVALLLTAVAAAIFAVHSARKVPQRLLALCAALLLLAAVALQLLLFYHLAVLCGLAGIVVAYRTGGAAVLRGLSMFVLASAALAAIQIVVLASKPGSLVQLVGALVGQPSVWPYVRVTEFSAGAAVLAACATLWGLWRIANRGRAPDYALLALLGVWIPMFVLGLFTWNMPSRYAAASLLPMLVCAFACAQQALDWLGRRVFAPHALRWWQPATALATLALIVNPRDAAAAIDSGYESHPDHKGAAEFMRSVGIRPGDIVLAEDVLEQTYYLGHVDYWLISHKHASRYVMRRDGEVRDSYTGTRVIDTGEQLQQLLDSYPDRRIFVIGSGENQSDGRREMRGFGIFEVLESGQFKVLYTGRDGTTQIWQAQSRRGSEPSTSRTER